MMFGGVYSLAIGLIDRQTLPWRQMMADEQRARIDFEREMREQVSATSARIDLLIKICGDLVVAVANASNSRQELSRRIGRIEEGLEEMSRIGQ